MIEVPPSTAAPTADRLRLGRLGPFLLVGQLGWAVPGAASATLLQSIAADLAPADKIGVYTMLAVVGAITSALGTVVGGVLSDRTRSRFGKRTPWLIGSSVIAVLGLATTGMTQSIVVIAIGVAIFQAGIGSWVAALSALIPDRVSAGAVGRASAFAGFGYLLGQTVGGVIGGAFVTRPQTGLIAIPWVLVVAAVLIAVFVRGVDNRAGARPTASRHFLRDLVPPASRDFWFAFAGRFLFILSIVTLSLFQLFILTDYLGLTRAESGEIIGLSTVVFGVLAAVAVVITGPLSDRIGRKKPFVVGAPLLVALALVPVVVAPGIPTYLLFYCVTGLAFGTYISVDQALMVAVLPNKATAARDLGFLSIGSTLPGVVAPVVGGILVSTLGYGSIFAVSIAIALLAAAAIFFIRSVR